ncbi:glycoside hydrolase family 43 protein [Parvularcula maris]|uniref:Glycoside hydrolase family 43 protein n=1 Tax=Parvularcula maris TaxID=2965077 RepID=A0A9X2RII8_9PROT|nr:glycoside hydrolase family 43 protein [Parvularcula maris]MCQ8186105.1 glycoside hydrolase family 43 protein [Parvularcula maris]
MPKHDWRAAFLTLLVAGCTGPDGAGAADPARFHRFVYEGSEPENLPRPGPGQYANPILAGFYPDPSITRAGDKYYLVTSTFAYFPGIPVFESRDLVSWTQVGNVIDRAGMLDFTGLGLSRGVFAPTIEFHDGLFHVANTCVDCGGNFVVTAEDPKGPWSDPIWLSEVGGIDPGLFFDEDGKVYVINNDAPEGEPRYEGHRAVWIREVDPETFQSISEPRVLIDGGVRPEENPVWIEGPHIYRVGERYYLSAAEGGTAINHSQVVLRADNVLGPYTPYEENPILTQRHLPPDRENPITSVGHADLVTDAEGQWWATFLGIRPYEEDYHNLGRETFLMRVEWKDGWPVMMSGEEEVPYVADRPALPKAEPPALPTRGAFRVENEFDEPLGYHWMTVRGDPDGFSRVKDGDLLLELGRERLGERGKPSLLVRRVQHTSAEAVTELTFSPAGEGEEAGLVILQSDGFFYKLGVGRGEEGLEVRLRKKAGDDAAPLGDLVARAPLAGAGPVELRVALDGGEMRFFYREDKEEWLPLGGVQDARILSTKMAGGFVGATVGVYAESGE